MTMINTDMSQAPRQGLFKLYLDDGSELIAHRTAQQGWASATDPTGKHIPILSIIGWAPYDGPSPKLEPARKPPHRPTQIAGGQKALEAAQACVARRQAARGRTKIRKPVQVVGLKRPVED